MKRFVAAGRKHYCGDLSGRWILTAGLGGMGGAQPLAATMASTSLLAVECDPGRIRKRIETRYLDETARDLDDALARIRAACEARKPVSVGLRGNAAEVYPELVARGVRPDLVTDQTSAHDPLNGYLPAGWSLEQAVERRARDPAGVVDQAKASMAVQVRAMLAFKGPRRPGGGLRQQHPPDGVRGRCRGCVRLSRVRACLHPRPLLRGQGAVPLGGPVRGSGGRLPYRREGEGAGPR